MKKLITLCSILALVLLFANCHKANPFPESELDERLSGGLATIFDETSKAFTHSIEGLNFRQNRVHQLGDNSFNQTFITAPAPVNSGLGSVFNNVSCISCHHNDGKGTPTTGTPTSSLFLRISIPGTDEHGGPNPVPGFGTQLKDMAIFGKMPQAKVQITYTNIPVNYPDGSTATLQKPTYTIISPYRALPSDILISPRMAPPIFGTGLIENIPESTILAFAAVQSNDPDGIRGRPNYVYDAYQQKMVLGRFGLKANNPTLLVQSAGAFQQDIGITNYVFKTESTAGQPQYDGLNDDPELPDSILNNVVFYMKTLAVPARRNVAESNIVAGKNLFTQVRCAACHIPSVNTGVDVTLPQISNQRIQIFTDLLLHDMGAGLADGRPDFAATGNDWKTPALWGIGLFEKTNGIAHYLHDGRARTIEEAILWHGGEASKAKDRFMNLTLEQRNQLLAFIKSL